MPELLGFTAVRENVVYHIDSLSRGEAGINQPIPDGGFTGYERVVMLTNG